MEAYNDLSAYEPAEQKFGDDLCGKKTRLLNEAGPLPSQNRSTKMNFARYWIHDMIRENGELRNLVSQRDAETKQLRIRNTEMEEMLRKFGTILVDAGTAMELAAKNEKPPTKVFT
jgi:hypothetical protein